MSKSKNTKNFEDKMNLKLKDNMTLEILNDLIDNYINNYKIYNKINEKLINDNKKHKKIRNTNFPSEITENIVKFVMAKEYKIMPSWNTVVGDLETWEEISDFKLASREEISDFKLASREEIRPSSEPSSKEIKSLKIEVKGFSTDGATSFGPDTRWDRIYFVDAKDFVNKNFEVFEINLTNKDEKWRELKFTKGEPVDEGEVRELPDDFNKLNKTQLIDLCKNRGINCSGNRTVLIDNLKTMKINQKFPTSKYYEICDKGKRAHGSFNLLLKSQLGDNCKSLFKGNISELVKFFEDESVDSLTKDLDNKLTIKKEVEI